MKELDLQEECLLSVVRHLHHHPFSFFSFSSSFSFSSCPFSWVLPFFTPLLLFQHWDQLVWAFVVYQLSS